MARLSGSADFHLLTNDVNKYILLGMSSKRQLIILDRLRASPSPIAGKVLAEATGTSVRTLYRDIEALQAQGAAIGGGPGVGFVLEPTYMVPAMMLNRHEMEAILLGTRWVADRGDVRLGEAAQTALAKLAHNLPKEVQGDLEAGGLLVGDIRVPETHIDPDDMRRAIRNETCVYMAYIDLKGVVTERTVWPIALTFLDHLRILVVWCELRQAFRHFRTERIMNWKALDIRYPKRRYALLKSWRETVKDSGSQIPEVKNANMLTGFGNIADETLAE